MPATHHSSAPPTRKPEAPPVRRPATAGPPAAEPPSTDGAPGVGRIPVLDVRPFVQRGRRPAKAVTGETFEVSATVFREGHDAVAA
ncbi:maltotransferase domain-containing protein, partial [Streptomyces sp. P17]|uniref:maltotransferase domain-containing protein n=1 Tax=Streptomyces sp. P17 TaxID=3074716 RepID=UPI0028F430C1